MVQEEARMVVMAEWAAARDLQAVTLVSEVVRLPLPLLVADWSEWRLLDNEH
jgi:hypothetical protein